MHCKYCGAALGERQRFCGDCGLPVASAASADNIEPETVAIEPETVALKPETVAIEPETVALEPETVALEPETVILPAPAHEGAALPEGIGVGALPGADASAFSTIAAGPGYDPAALERLRTQPARAREEAYLKTRERVLPEADAARETAPAAQPSYYAAPEAPATQRQYRAAEAPEAPATQRQHRAGEAPEAPATQRQHRAGEAPEAPAIQRQYRAGEAPEAPATQRQHRAAEAPEAAGQAPYYAAPAAVQPPYYAAPAQAPYYSAQEAPSAPRRYRAAEAPPRQSFLQDDAAFAPAGEQEAQKPAGPYKPIGTWNFVFSLIALALPVIGFILSLIWGFVPGINRNRRSLARAKLILWFTALVLTVVGAYVLYYVLLPYWGVDMNEVMETLNALTTL